MTPQQRLDAIAEILLDAIHKGVKQKDGESKEDKPAPEESTE